jgi:ribosome-binding ATPase
MSLTAGIVGLPNVGKSTLFNAITRSQVEAANYPFATIDKNVGVVEVPDPRLYELAALFNPKKTIPTTFEFTDIAGLVKGAASGEGLGNKFLSHIREVDAIVHVVRCFKNDDVIHVEGSVDPIRDIEIIDVELALADLASVLNRIDKVARKAKSNDKIAIAELDVLQKCVQPLNEGKRIYGLDFSDEEKTVLKGFHLLTNKPVIYVANLSEQEISNPQQNPHYQAVVDYAKTHQALVIPISAKIEEEISLLEEEEKAMFLEELGIQQSGLDQIIVASYDILHLKTYFTAGPQEVRAWTFTSGMKAPECAGIIHSDFEKGFIKAEAYHIQDILTYKTEAALKDAGKLRIEGKAYEVKDGDVLHFRFNV